MFFNVLPKLLSLIQLEVRVSRVCKGLEEKPVTKIGYLSWEGPVIVIETSIDKKKILL